MPLSLPPLSVVATRVLATLVEKQRTVPDTYPLSINALAAGCNQKTSRNPVLELGEAEILQAIDELKDLGLVSEASGSRVARFAHNLEKQLGVPTQSSALLAVLMLRGPQTAGELRLNCERLHKFADISSVEAFLDELAAHDKGPLVLRLARLPGTREERWMHLLAGEPAADAQAAGVAGKDSQELDELKARVNALETEVAELKALFAARSEPV